MDEQVSFPQNWQINQEFDPNKHISKFMGRDYLNVQNRLLWFIRDQRAFIASGLSCVPYIIRTDLIEIDRKDKWAHFKTYIRDVLGNEATMYGSETAADFPDYIEKASTKSLGRALLLLGYGTAFAPEMDEGERVVDAPASSTVNTTATAQRDETRHAADNATTTQQSVLASKLRAWLVKKGYTTVQLQDGILRQARVDVTRALHLTYDANELAKIYATVKAETQKAAAS